MKRIVLIFVACLISCVCDAQSREGIDYKYIPGSSKPAFEFALKGIKSYNFALVSNGRVVSGNGMFIDAYVCEQMIEWAKDIIPDAMFGIDSRYPRLTYMSIIATYLHDSWIDWNGNTQWRVRDLSVLFVLGGDLEGEFHYEFQLPDFTVRGGNFEQYALYKALLKNVYGYRKNFLKTRVLQLPKYQTDWTESSLKQYYESNADKFEGIYESIDDAKGGDNNKYKLGLKKLSDGNYALIYLDGEYLFDDLKEGEIKAWLYPTGTPGLYKATWVMANKSLSKDCYITFSLGDMQVRLNSESTTYLKLYPTAEVLAKNATTSGTGFFLSTNGYIITNHHVIEDARNGNIKVTGVNEDYSKYYTAKVEVSDKQNDLAILKITDPSFTKIASIPYSFKLTTSGVGENCFVLGYPLVSSMGKEIKLTNGIISSKTGYDGNVAQYQISAPIQPGNSGGPLFDKNGNIIGIVQAKHTQAENAGYAIKASYIKNLLDLLPTTITLPQKNMLYGKSLPQQVEMASKAVVLIIVNGK